MTIALPNPFDFVPQIDIDMLCLHAVAGALAIEPPPVEDLPAFLESPRPEYLTAVQLRPICEIITNHARRASH